jgi:hypothetical protein
MNPDTRVCRRCIDAVEFRALARGFGGVEPAFLWISETGRCPQHPFIEPAARKIIAINAALGPSSLADDDTIGRSAGPGYAGIDKPTPVDKSGLVVDRLRPLDIVRERRGAISRTDSHCPWQRTILMEASPPPSDGTL